MTLLAEEIPTTDAAMMPPPSSPRRLRRAFHRTAIGLAFTAVIVCIVLPGLWLRHWAWNQTEPIRFTFDISNAFAQGSDALRSGYLNRYDNQELAHGTDENYHLDYAPARLLIATEWARYVRGIVDHQTNGWELTPRWRNHFYDEARSLHLTYTLCKPLLILNAIGEGIAGAGVLALVWIWTGRGDKYRRPAWRAFMACACFALFWFNPELIWNAHCWPQWDSWLLPFYLWALVAASLDFWFIAGLCIAVGVMFKAQILFGAPLLILWPVFGGRWRAVLKFVIGVFLGIALLTAVWLVRVHSATSEAAIWWLIGSAAAFALWLVVARRPGPWYLKLVIGLIAAGLSLWPFTQLAGKDLLIALAVLAVVVAMLRYLPRSGLRYTAAAWVAAALLLCPLLFGGSMAWFDIGIAYGTHHYIMMGSSSDNNLAEILTRYYHWQVMDPVTTFAPHTWPARLLGPILSTVDPRINDIANRPVRLPLKYVLFSVYVVGLVLCALGAALQTRWKSPRFLVAIAAPWIIFFAVVAQLHERYLLWGAATSACTAALGPGFAFLNLLVSIIAVGQEVMAMAHGKYASLPIVKFFAGWNPGVGWALMLIALIYLYTALTPSPTHFRANRRSPKTIDGIE